MKLSFRDLFALTVWFSSLLVFIMVAMGYHVPNAVLGQLMTLDALVVQFYFRKKPSNTGEEK